MAWIDLYGAYLDEVIIDENGLIYLAGDYRYDHFVARLSHDGQLDDSFGAGGVAIIDAGDGNSNFNAGSASLVRQSDGKIVTVSSTTDSAWDNPDAMRIVVARLLVGDETGHAGLLGFYAPVSAEEDDVIQIPVRRTGGSSGSVSVDYATDSGSAKSGEDFTQAHGTLTWGDGDMEDRVIEVRIAGDGANEDSETFRIELSKPTGGATIATRLINVQIAGTRGSAPRPPGGPEVSSGGGGGVIGVLGLWLLAGMATFRRGSSFQ
jgi:hypothetical protein